MQKLRTGAAYHGCRMLHHVEADMRDMADHHMNTVVHMMSHTDWERHYKVMKDITDISMEAGLEVWMDNWGPRGMARGFSATRRAIISAVITSILVSFSSAAASCQ